MTIKKESRHKRHENIRKWAKKHSEEIYDLYECKCHNCGTINHLTIHHKQYKIGLQYVELLCNDCHREFHRKELKKKLLIIYLKETEKYPEYLNLQEFKEILTAKIDSIRVDIIEDTPIDGLPF